MVLVFVYFLFFVKNTASSKLNTLVHQNTSKIATYTLHHWLEYNVYNQYKKASLVGETDNSFSYDIVTNPNFYFIFFLHRPRIKLE